MRGSAASAAPASQPLAVVPTAWAEWQHERLRGIESSMADACLPERSRLLDALSATIREAIAGGRPAAAILIDINGFAEINAAWGPTAGDEVLAMSGKRIADFAAERIAPGSASAPVTVGRLDSDHFAIVVPTVASEANLRAAATELVRMLAQPLSLSHQTIAVSARAAVVHIPAHGRTLTSVLGRGFRLLAKAARARADGVAVSEAETSPGVPTAMLERDLAAALSTDQLSIVLQPKVEVATGLVRGAEALARWNHRERGWVPPPVFIKCAEKSGLIFDLGLRILGDACRAANMFAAKGGALKVAVNVSAHQLAHPDFLSRFLEVIDREGTEPACLDIEITETAAMMGGERVLHSLQSLRRCGIGVAIDDFGTGFSNLAALAALPADTLKIDRSLVIAIERDERGEALLAVAMQLGRTFGLATVAEGVETTAQFRRIADLGCDFVQGYLTGRPVPAAEFAANYLKC